MKKHLMYAATLSAALLLPFIILEWRAREVVQSEWPYALFAFMFLLTFAFFLLGQVMPRASSTKRILGGVAMLFVAAVWLRLVVDQMPCFLGVPNCD